MIPLPSKIIQNRLVGLYRSGSFRNDSGTAVRSSYLTKLSQGSPYALRSLRNYPKGRRTLFVAYETIPRLTKASPLFDANHFCPSFKEPAPKLA